MTHGEAYVARRENIDFTHDIDKILRKLERLPSRMPRKNAIEYYGKKISQYFGTEEVKAKDFRTIEDYFDYFEAKRILHERHSNRGNSLP